MTDDIARELGELLEKASPGEWRVRYAEREGWAELRAPHWFDFAEFVIGTDDDPNPEGVANLNLFVKAREYLAALLSSRAADRTEIESLKSDLKEANEAIRELQQEACNRAGVPMPSQRSVVDKLREASQGDRKRIEVLEEALRLNYRAVNTLANMAEHPILTVVKQIEEARAAAQAALAGGKTDG